MRFCVPDKPRYKKPPGDVSHALFKDANDEEVFSVVGYGESGAIYYFSTEESAPAPVNADGESMPNSYGY